MDLYIVEGNFEYEGFTIMGIFDNEEAARARACEEACEGFDYVTISKMMLNTRYNVNDKAEEVWRQT